MLRYIDEELIIDRVPAGRDNGDQQVQRQLMGRGRGQGARARAWRVGRQDGPGRGRGAGLGVEGGHGRGGRRGGRTVIGQNAGRCTNCVANPVVDDLPVADLLVAKPPAVADLLVADPPVGLGHPTAARNNHPDQQAPQNTIDEFLA